MSVESSTLDATDRAIVRCLQVAPRGAFSTYAEVLATSEQTVARRYRRLRGAGVVRVTAVADTAALGQTNWVVRIRCRPNGTAALAQALAKRDDIGWVSISGGATEVVCVVRSTTAAAREDLLLERLARTAPVLGITAAMNLHPYVAGQADDWAGLRHELTGEQERRLREVTSTPPVTGTAPATGLDGCDRSILDALVVDGRSTYAQLAQAAGVTEGRAARRLQALLARGLIHLDVDLSAHALGWEVTANLWMSVPPDRLHPAGEALARIPEVTFATAITGPHNLLAAVVCRDHEDLYRLVTEQVGAVPGISSLEVSPQMRSVKQAGALVEHDRLAT